MELLRDISYFGAGVFFANAVPHVVSGMMGRPFQTPFAKPPGKGLSSSTVNVVWGFLNLVIGYALLAHAGTLDWRALDLVGSFGIGAFLMSLMHAWGFGRFNGGNSPRGS